MTTNQIQNYFSIHHSQDGNILLHYTESYVSVTLELTHYRRTNPSRQADRVFIIDNNRNFDFQSNCFGFGDEH